VSPWTSLRSGQRGESGSPKKVKREGAMAGQKPLPDGLPPTIDGARGPQTPPPSVLRINITTHGPQDPFSCCGREYPDGNSSMVHVLYICTSSSLEHTEIRSLNDIYACLFASYRPTQSMYSRVIHINARRKRDGIKIISLIAIKGVYSSCVSSRPMYWFLRNSPHFCKEQPKRG
jgi:hypothetical protein